MILQLLHSCLTFFVKSGLSCASYRGVWFSGSSSAIVGPLPPPPPLPPPQPAAARPARASSDTIAIAGLPRIRRLGRLLLFSVSFVMLTSSGRVAVNAPLGARACRRPHGDSSRYRSRGRGAPRLGPVRYAARRR